MIILRALKWIALWTATAFVGLICLILFYELFIKVNQPGAW